MFTNFGGFPKTVLIIKLFYIKEICWYSISKLIFYKCLMCTLTIHFMKNLWDNLRQNLPNSSFLEKILVHSMRMKHFSKLDCFWNSSLTNSSSNPFPLGWSLTWTKKKKKTWNLSLRNSSSICTELEFPKLEFLVRNLETRVSETLVPLKK